MIEPKCDTCPYLSGSVCRAHPPQPHRAKQGDVWRQAQIDSPSEQTCSLHPGWSDRLTAARNANRVNRAVLEPYKPYNCPCLRIGSNAGPGSKTLTSAAGSTLVVNLECPSCRGTGLVGEPETGDSFHE